MKENRKQLMFNDITGEIVDEEIKYWKSFNEVPDNIRNFILETLKSKVIYDNEKYYCSMCLKELDSNYHCSNCSKSCIVPSNSSKYVINTSIKDIKDYWEKTNYFVFDYVEGEILLYNFLVNTTYYNSLLLIPHQINDVRIEEVYRVTNNGVESLLTNLFYSFDEYDKDMDSEDFNFDLIDIFESLVNNHYLYTDNLKMLKDISFYKYSSIWELKEYYEKENFTLSSLTYYPIHFKEFEYLVKLKLYDLAINSTNQIKYRNNFKDTFGVDKKYYLFMKEININMRQLEVLKLYPTSDLELINFISYSSYIFKELIKYVSPNKIKSYLESQNLDNNYIQEYYDYLMSLKEMGFDLKDRKILFPKNLILEHDKIIAEMIIATDPKLDERINSLSDILKLNIYEDEKYIIFPAHSVSSLIDESFQMSNCVRNYCKRVSDNECQIYFMRYKDSKNKSLVTIEVRDGVIVQARTRFNKLPSDEINKVLKNWEKRIILVENI